MTKSSIQNNVIEQALDLLRALSTAIDDRPSRVRLFRAAGWDLTQFSNTTDTDVVNILTSIVSNTETIVEFAEEPPQSIEEFRILLNAIKQLFETLSALSEIAEGASMSDFIDISKDLCEHVLVVVMHKRNPRLVRILNLLGLVELFYETNPVNAIIDSSTDRKLRWPVQLNRLHLDRIPQLLSNPVDHIRTEYGWPSNGGNLPDSATSLAVAQKLFPRLSHVFDFSPVRGAFRKNTLTDVTFDATTEELLQETLILSIVIEGEVYARIALTFSPTDRGDLGLVIGIPLFDTISEELGAWNITLTISSPIDGIAIGTQNFTLPASFSEQTFEAKVSARKNADPNGKALVIGGESGTRLELDRLSLGANVLLSPSFKEYGATVEMNGAKIIVHPGEGDGFLKKILPEEGLIIDFDLITTWNNVHGLHFSGSGGLEVEIPIHRSILNILNIDSVRASIRAASDVAIVLSANADVKLGPVTLSVADVGLKSTLTFPAGSDGNLGPLNFDLDFKSPTGVGISINSPTITGGGFLNFDEATKTYTGALELSFKKFSLQAFGIISTQLPDGGEGYSLLIFITAQFNPFPIGMGFTLNGVGGMLGMNRSTDIAVLRAGIRDNTLNNILFPTDIIQNASTIISKANEVFPVQEGRFVFGPLAKLGWGSPNILTIDMGIVIEVPDPVTLAILGVLRSILPDTSKETIKLQVNFLGLIDFDKQQLSFDASIYDSHLLNYTLSGDMALRLSWGNQPNFLVTVGGFHPSYTPPPLNLPELRRIAVQIFNEENLRVRFDCYFALTSNSAQFGAKLDAYAAAGKYNAIALLWFDVLFQFSPFHMLANIGVQAVIRRNNDVLFGAFLDLSLEGPAPWRVWGQVSFEICKINFHINFDKTFGQGAMETNMPVAVLAKLQTALDDPRNWVADFPDRNNQLVALTDPELPESTLLVSPFGNLTFSQQLLPLDILFSKFGNAALLDYKRFEFINLRDGNDIPLSSVKKSDLFAANEFYYLSDAEKLSRPSYEAFDNGITITGTGALRSSYANRREYKYEEIVIDLRQRVGTLVNSVHSNDFEAQLMGNTISQSTVSASQHVVPHNAPSRVTVSQKQFTIVNVDDLSLYGNIPTYFNSETEAEQYLNSLISSNSMLFNQLIVADQLELVA